ncbi:Astacin-like metalloendopeptidase [Strongyloides ratti]|uniref:Metalloendopeptidase n=1 Tax=Strongyloides ratti TaxID=34506 RepID=A0A090N0G0_STRRB|nr:Astacin-like metalloendopeptidase [Strongyloides ratti]CEF70623.1 Astacin-like metalloendopeptidase [Strongyloides ratti]
MNSKVVTKHAFFLLILLKNYFTIEEYITKKNFKRSVDQINNFIFNFSETFYSKINSRKKRKIVSNEHAKWYLPINYHVSEPLNPFVIRKVIETIEKETCIKFQYQKSFAPFTTGIIYLYTGNCLSFVGNIRRDNWQVVEIGKRCDYVGGILHETLHALGLYHEQCRFDRDFFVKIYKENMMKSNVHDCQKYNVDSAFHYHLSYDYGSIMQYPVDAFSINGRKTMVPIDPLYEGTMGQMERLSFIDSKILNLHYCSHMCTFKKLCYNYGYQDPQNCHICRCIEGFTGPLCKDFEKKRPRCGAPILFTLKTVKFMILKGKKNCIYHFISKQKKKILLNILKLYMFPNYQPACKYNNVVEIKYWMDKSVTGARFCLQQYNKKILSHTDSMILHYRSLQNTNFVQLTYRELN